MFRSEAVVLPTEEEDELEDVVFDMLLPDRDVASCPRSAPDLFPVDFFANNLSFVWEIMNTDEIIVTATNIVIVHAPSLLLFIKELQYSVYVSFHISIFEYIS
jgi:hypothetical protein